MGSQSFFVLHFYTFSQLTSRAWGRNDGGASVRELYRCIYTHVQCMGTLHIIHISQAELVHVHICMCVYGTYICVCMYRCVCSGILI